MAKHGEWDETPQGYTRNSIGWLVKDPQPPADGVKNLEAYKHAMKLKQLPSYRDTRDPAHDEVVREVNWNLHRAYGEEADYPASKGANLELGAVEKQALADAKEGMKHPAYTDDRHPKHLEVVRGVRRLMVAAYGTPEEIGEEFDREPTAHEKLFGVKPVVEKI